MATQLISCLRSDPLLSFQMICRRVLLEILILVIIVPRTLTHIQCRCFHLNSSVNFVLCRATSIQRNWSHDDVSPKVIISMKPITHVKFVMYSSLNYFAGIIISITPSFIDIQSSRRKVRILFYALWLFRRLAIRSAFPSSVCPGPLYLIRDRFRGVRSQHTQLHHPGSPSRMARCIRKQQKIKHTTSIETSDAWQVSRFLHWRLFL